MLTVVIPTLNEEDQLASLLNSIQGQGLDSYQVIVADAGSNDGTLKIAKDYNCQVVSGGSPAEGRNEGAKAADSSLTSFTSSSKLSSVRTLAFSCSMTSHSIFSLGSLPTGLTRFGILTDGLTFEVSVPVDSALALRDKADLSRCRPSAIV